MRLQTYLTEKLIVIGKGQKYGQIVFLAGGAGSGKGFTATNFMEKEKFLVRDVDEMKRIILKLNKIRGTHPEVAGLNLRNGNDVFKLHMYVKKLGWKDKSLDLLLSGVTKGRLPNIMFDVTLKDTGDITDVLPTLIDLGYDPKDVHLVWVLTKYKIAVEQNYDRERVVPDDVLLMTHKGAAVTMTDIIRGKVKMTNDSSMFNGAIYVVLGNKENTIFVTTQDTRATLKNREQMGGSKIKHPLQGKDEKGKNIESFVIKDFKYLTIKDIGKPVDTDQRIRGELHNWIVDNIPKSRDTRNIFRRKGL